MVYSDYHCLYKCFRQQSRWLPSCWKGWALWVRGLKMFSKVSLLAFYASWSVKVKDTMEFPLFWRKSDTSSKEVSINILAAKGELRSLHSLLDAWGSTVSREEENAEVPNAFFVSVFNTKASCAQGSQQWQLDVRDEELSEVLIIPEERVNDLLSQSDTNLCALMWCTWEYWGSWQKILPNPFQSFPSSFGLLEKSWLTGN